MTDLFTATQTIKTLSLWQPWASLMVAGFKLHETRHWSTIWRGPLAIHAAKTVDVAGAPDELCIAAFGRDWREVLPRGAIVGIGVLTRCVPTASVRSELTRADFEAGNFTPGRFAWTIEAIQALAQPIPLAGRQGLFNWSPPDDLSARLRAPVDHREQCRQIGWLA